MTKQITLNTLDAKIDKVAETVENLAISVKRGFDETATKADMAEVREELKEVKEELQRDIHRVENILAGGLTNRIEDLEDDVRILKTRAGIR